jgi:hypothetical protein
MDLSGFLSTGYRARWKSVMILGCDLDESCPWRADSAFLNGEAILRKIRGHQPTMRLAVAAGEIASVPDRSENQCPVRQRFGA